MRKNKVIETLEDALYDLTHGSTVPAKVQAEILGVSYSRLVNSCLSTAETAFHHTRWIVPQTLAAKNYSLIDYIERRCGRVAFLLPDIMGPLDSEGYRAGLMKITKELGELAAVTEESLSDKAFNRRELAENKKEVWDLIEQAVRYYMSLADKG